MTRSPDVPHDTPADAPADGGEVASESFVSFGVDAPPERAPRAAVDPDPSERGPRRAVLAFEWLVVFVGVPFVAWLEVLPLGVFEIFAAPVLYGVLVWFGSGMGRRARHAAAREAERDAPHTPTTTTPRERWRFAVVVAVAAVALFAFAALHDPTRFARIPRTNPSLWLVILLAYPWVSALPQEFLYRRFYWRRYARLFRDERVLVATNVFAFTVLHALYDAWLTLGLSAIGGALFAWHYHRTRSLRDVAIAHAILGLAIFSSGLDHYFYEPPPR